MTGPSAALRQSADDMQQFWVRFLSTLSAAIFP